MILIDARTGSRELAPHITSPKTICHLDYADFAFSGNGPEGQVGVGVERKTLMDLLQSMTSGRLSGHQVIGLREQYDEVYLLVEGVWRPHAVTGVLMRIGGKGKWIAAAQGSRRFMVRDVWNFCHSLTNICGVHVVCTSNMTESGRWLDATFAWWNKRWTDHKSHAQWVRPREHATFRKPGLTTRFFAQLDGIGWDKAKKLGEFYPDMEAVIHADEKELQTVDGIGPKLAKSIIKQIRG